MILYFLSLSHASHGCTGSGSVGPRAGCACVGVAREHGDQEEGSVEATVVLGVVPRGSKSREEL